MNIKDNMDYIYNKWNILRDNINTYINLEKKYNILNINTDMYKKWIKSKSNNELIKEINIFNIEDIVEKIGEIISQNLYNNHTFFDYSQISDNKIYVFNINGTIAHLIEWKIINSKTIFIRYGAFGFVEYVYIKI